MDVSDAPAAPGAGPLTPEALAEAVRWGPDGLVPAVAVDRRTGEVLMLAYMDREALAQTLRTGRATYFSRSRGRLWTKGETSGNVQEVREVRLDCDGDALVLVVDQRGAGACHTGAWSCFFRRAPLPNPPGSHDAPPEGTSVAGAADARILDELRAVIADRRRHPRPGSYTASLLARGADGPLKKLAEEAGEVILAAKDVQAASGPGGEGAGGPALQKAREALAWEAADLLYHLLVVLEQAGLPSEAVWQELRRRRGR